MKSNVIAAHLNNRLGHVRFQIISEAADHLVCKRFLNDGSLKATTENVAKPYLLRNSITSRDGQTFVYESFSTRTASAGVESEEQTVVPSYVAGDQIYAFKPVNGTGVETAPKWQEQLGSRAWTMVYEA